MDMDMDVDKDMGMGMDMADTVMDMDMDMDIFERKSFESNIRHGVRLEIIGNTVFKY
jgi:hypothetical protein